MRICLVLIFGAVFWAKAFAQGLPNAPVADDKAGERCVYLNIVSLIHPQSFWHEQHWQGQAQSRSARSDIGSLEVPRSSVLQINSQHISAGGDNHWGVFDAQTENGSTALKIHNGRTTLVQNSQWIFAQKQLAELGLAPKIYGVLSEQEVRAFLQEHPELVPRNEKKASPTFGVLMEKIPEGWDFRNHKSPPEAARNWDLKSIHSQIVAIGKILDQLNFDSRDTQFLISADGRVYLYDFEISSAFSAQTYKPDFKLNQRNIEEQADIICSTLKEFQSQPPR